MNVGYGLIKISLSKINGLIRPKRMVLGRFATRPKRMVSEGEPAKKLLVLPGAVAVQALTSLEGERGEKLTFGWFLPESVSKFLEAFHFFLVSSSQCAFLFHFLLVYLKDLSGWYRSSRLILFHRLEGWYSIQD